MQEPADLTATRDGPPVPDLHTGLGNGARGRCQLHGLSADESRQPTDIDLRARIAAENLDLAHAREVLLQERGELLHVFPHPGIEAIRAVREHLDHVRMGLDEPALQIQRPGQGVADERIIPVREGSLVERRGLSVLLLFQELSRLLEELLRSLLILRGRALRAAALPLGQGSRQGLGARRRGP